MLFCSFFALLLCVGMCFVLCSCTQNENVQNKDEGQNIQSNDIDDKPVSKDPSELKEEQLEQLRTQLSLVQDYRAGFNHGEKGAVYQKYIVLHDTEGEADAKSVISYWEANGTGVAAHFVINKDGSIVQCVGMDSIAHHAGFGNTGNNALFGVEDESRDDKIGTVSIGNNYADYGMNSFSIGIELVHVGGSGDYPQAQLDALDLLIAYIDTYCGFESTIIDHKEWRSSNSDTSPEFASYFANYKDHRTHYDA